MHPHAVRDRLTETDRDRYGHGQQHAPRAPRRHRVRMIKQYKKRPVVINAAGPLTPQNQNMIAEWCQGKAKDHQLPGPGRGLTAGIIIHTLEGDMSAAYGDYVIQGVEGEFYPCRYDIFEQTYELVSGEE